MARVIQRCNLSVPLCDMMDGEVAEIIKWCDAHTPVGSVIQRYGSEIIVIGKSSAKGYPDLLGSQPAKTECFVKILPEGAQIVL